MVITSLYRIWVFGIGSLVNVMRVYILMRQKLNTLLYTSVMTTGWRLSLHLKKMVSNGFKIFNLSLNNFSSLQREYLYLYWNSKIDLEIIFAQFIKKIAIHYQTGSKHTCDVSAKKQVQTTFIIPHKYLTSLWAHKDMPCEYMIHVFALSLKDLKILTYLLSQCFCLCSAISITAIVILFVCYQNN